MTTSTQRPELDDLRGRVAGTVTGRDDPGYDEARAVWNGIVDRRPWAVVRAAGVDDIAPTILSLFGLPIPEHVEGRPLAGLAIPSTTRMDSPSASIAGPHRAQFEYTPEEQVLIEQRLADLGYLE